MKKSLSKALSVLLALIMAVSVVPVSLYNASAATSGTCGENLTWVYDTSTCTLTISGTGAMYEYWSYNQPWAEHKDNIKSVVIDDGVTTIGSYAFSNCNNLADVTIGKNVETIGDSAFSYCGIVNMTVDEENQYYCADDDGVLFNKDKTVLVRYSAGHERTSYTIPDSVITIGKRAFDGSDNLLRVTISDSVTTIGSYAFSDCNNLAEVTIGKNVKSIGAYAFHSCYRLTSITIPDSVTTIGSYAFGVCINLADVTIGKNVETIGNSAFSFCGIVNMTVDKENQYYCADDDGVLFNKDKTVLIRYPAGHERTSYTVPDSVITIDDAAFIDSDNLLSVTISDGVTAVDSWAFDYCGNLESITIPETVDSIGNYAFYSCEKLKDVYYCGTQEQWDDIVIGEENECLLNATVHYSAASGTCGDNLTWILDFSTGTITISGTGFMDAYPSYNQPWRSFMDDIKKVVVTDGVLTVGGYAFFGHNNIKSVIIGNDVTHINPRAFAGCDSLESVTLGDSVEVISSYAFYICEKLESIEFPDSLSQVGLYSFGGCHNLKSVLFGNGISYIDKLAFSGAGLTSLVIPDSVNYIGEFAFWQCDDIISITIGSGLEIIDENAFLSCTGITDITVDENNLYFSSDDQGVLFNKDKTTLIHYPMANERTSYTVPDGVITIGEDAFINSGNLESVIIPETVDNIASYAFGYCENLKDVYYCGTQEQWNDIVIGEKNECLLNATIHYNYCPHSYVAAVTAPTCTEKGFTTYTCECGDSYVADYVAENGHSHTSEITTPATHLTEGVKTFTCHCGDSYTEAIEKIAAHNHIAAVTAPTCTEKGFTTYTCECGDSYVADYVDATGHSDTDNDGNCNVCDEHLCDHACHKSGVLGFFWKIVCFFSKLFGLNRFCECGTAHY